VSESWHSAEFYLNKLLMECRGSSPPLAPLDAAMAWSKGIKVQQTKLV
jgi:hypothetical protein